MSLDRGGATAATDSDPQETALATLREAYLERLTRPGPPFTLASAFPLPADLPALYDQLSELKACLDSFRPFDPTQLEKLLAAFDIEYTYNSNRIEGNTLTLMETHLVINEGITIAGKPLREHLEATNHQEAIDFIRDLAARGEPLTPYNLKQIHALVLHAIDRPAAGVYRSVPLTISGSRHVPPQPYMVEKLMEDLFIFYDANKSTMHPVELAAQFHEKLVTVHPFKDGNGRTARLVMNLILLGAGYPIAVVSAEDAERTEYNRALEEAQIVPAAGNVRFQRFIAQTVRHWLLRYLDFLSVDVSAAGKNKGRHFFQAIAPALGGAAKA